MDRRRSPLILVTDDDSSLRSLLVMALTAAGYTMAEAVNGKECLLKVERLQPDLLLLDALMPEMDGFSCCQQLRSRPQTQNLPILMITFLDDHDSIEQAFQAGATDYITKPIHWQVLRQRVQGLLNSAQLEHQANLSQLQLQQHQLRNKCFSQILAHLAQCPALTPALVPILTPMLEILAAQRLLIYDHNYVLLWEAQESHLASALDYSLADLALLAPLAGEPKLRLIAGEGLPPPVAEILGRWETTALLLCPICLEDQVRGWLCLHAGSNYSGWDEVQQNHCQDLAHLFALLFRGAM
jgi:DNA-binding response OmpR family regulator